MITKQIYNGEITFKNVLDLYKEVIQGKNKQFKNYKLFGENKKEELKIIESKQGGHNYSYRKRKGYEEIAHNKKAQKQLRSIDDLLQKEISYASMYALPKRFLKIKAPFIQRTKIDIKKMNHEQYEISFCSKKDITNKFYETIKS